VRDALSKRDALSIVRRRVASEVGPAERPTMSALTPASGRAPADRLTDREADRRRQRRRDKSTGITTNRSLPGGDGGAGERARAKPMN